MNELQWKAIYSNDRAFDGKFFYALSTTKTVCNPSCTSRTPNPKNVTIFIEFESAISHGYRPCNRCKPDQTNWEGYKVELVTKVKHFIEQNSDENISLYILSNVFDKNPHYIQRVFKSVTGESPLYYLHEVRISKAKNLLKHTSNTITAIALEIGYSSSAHFSRKFKGLEKVTPREYRKL